MITIVVTILVLVFKSFCNTVRIFSHSLEMIKLVAVVVETSISAILAVIIHLFGQHGEN